MNTPVKFELAKLLKEKGFDKITDNWYSWTGKEIFKNDKYFVDISPTFAPTIAEVVMWLYEKHGIWIECKAPNLYHNVWYCLVVKINVSNDYEHCSEEYSTPTEAYAAAIEYVLTELI